MAEEYALKNGLNLTSKDFQDLGISAIREGTRPSLADMLTAIDEGYITSGSTIIIEASDRPSRRCRRPPATFHRLWVLRLPCVTYSALQKFICHWLSFIYNKLSHL
jgi:DNA invertase Pin-like site-specific DNA recombinase